MSDYEYIDTDGDKLLVLDAKGYNETGFYIGGKDREGRTHGVNVPNEDAPAVALAILEAAGITPDALSGNREQRAAAYLKAWSVEHARRAEREAGDAKVREFFLALNPGTFCAADVVVSDKVREQYRAARDYFAKEG